MSGTISVSISGPSDNQSFSADLNGRPFPETLSASVRRFGPAASKRRYGVGGENCRATWPARHIVGTFTVALSGITNGCIGGSGTIEFIVGAGYRTDTGLSVGATIRDLKQVYPRARSHGNRWDLVRYFYGAGYYVTELGAITRHGHVVSLTVAGVPDE